MLYYLYEVGLTHPQFSFLRLFWYVTFRAALAAFLAFVLVVMLGKPMVRWLCKFQAIAPPRLDANQPKELVQAQKRQVPSMGGLLIVAAVVVAVLLCAIPTQALVQIFVGLIVAMCGIGFLDDYLKVKKKSRDGLSAKQKFAMQIAVALIAVWLLERTPESAGYVRTLMVPFLKEPLFTNLPLWFALGFGVLVVVGASNAVNLADGLDGLATGCTTISALAYAIFAYACGTYWIADHLLVPYLPGSTEVAVIACAMAGATLGFLWHNCPPATMFMGDTGSLALGAAIGLIAVLVKQELLLIVIGGVFVLEAGSVILQVGWFKMSRRIYGEPRRLFLCSPYHHHLQHKGWKDTQVVIRFWIISLMLAGIGLATLKIR